ncbi:unnamed protein product [Urochloa humidicola]
MATGRRLAAPLLLLPLLLHLQCALAGAEDDAAALLSFKQVSVPVDPHGALAGWVNTSGSSPCAWDGVSCANGRVRALNLSSMSLAGRLTLDVLQLPQIKSLDLSNNGFYGNLSDHAFSRPILPCMLEDMDLSSNALNGTLPGAFLAACSKLKVLNISRNSLTGVGFPFPPSLRTLDISNNQLSEASLLNYTLTGCHRVECLNLSGNRFDGRIARIAPCSKLAVLDLSWNILSGPLPVDLVAAAPATLIHLNIARNNFSGDISAYNFGWCSNLMVLDWSYNGLSGKGLPSSLANCSRLETLDMSGNKLSSGLIPTFLGNFPSLRRLKLAGNSFFGKIPHRLSLLCGKLVELDLSSNQLMGSLPATFASCRSLELLDLGINQLSGDFVVTVISNMSSLRVLRLPFNNIKGANPVPALATGCPLLEEIALGSNELDGEIMPDLCSSLPRLQKLILPNNYLNGVVPPSLGQCANLELIDLSFNLLVGPIPPEVMLLPKLVDLVLWANHLSGEIPDMFCSNGTALETLEISYNNFTGSIPPSITRCANLSWLSLASNHLTGNVPPGFSNLKKLAILQLYKNSLSDRIPEELGHCNSLIWVDLSSNYFTGAIPPQLAAQAGLVAQETMSIKRYAFIRNGGVNICAGTGLLFEFLDIRPERLAESLAKHFCQPARIYIGTTQTVHSFRSNGSMMFLDLSSNGLTGEIPASFGSMMYLEVLNLGHNNLTGAIPDAFAGLRKIGVLDLSHNRLTGAIPPELGTLSFLTDFDVSNNHLIGEIPRLGQLMTFPASCYDNNSGLCGIPLRPCKRIGSRKAEPQDTGDGQVPLVSATGLGIGLAFGLTIGVGSGMLLPF